MLHFIIELAYLKNEISKLYPWVKPVYQKTSGFIHISGYDILAPVKEVKDIDRTITFELGGPSNWKETDMRESVQAFIATTKGVLDLVHSWLVVKKRVGAAGKNMR